MHDPGTLIAVSVILVYTLLGPVVLFAVYVLFDHINRKEDKPATLPDGKKNPALWSREEVKVFLEQMQAKI